MSLTARNVTMDSERAATTQTSAATPAEPPSFGDEMGSDIVTLVVGPEKYVFSVHRKFLCKKIKYFERMFLGGFRESSTNTATFPEDDRKSFGLLLKWVYDGTIPQIVYFKEGGVWKENWYPIKLYQLADKLGIPEVMDRTLDAFITSMKRFNLIPAVDEIDDGYARTPPGSKLREFFCYVFVYRVTNSSDMPGCLRNEQAQKLISDQPDLAYDMIPLLRNAASTGYTSMLQDLPSCKYHNHNPELAVCPWKHKKSKAEQQDKEEVEEEEEEEEYTHEYYPEEHDPGEWP